MIAFKGGGSISLRRLIGYSRNRAETAVIQILEPSGRKRTFPVSGSSLERLSNLLRLLIESKRASLFAPVTGEGGDVYLMQCKVRRLTAIEDHFDDVRSDESEPHDFLDVTVRIAL